MTHAKQVILSSFIKLIDGINIEKVTVKQIIEDTDLSRQTFYYYFDNIEKMIKNCILDDTEEICKSIGALTDWERSLRLYIPFLHKYETVIRNPCTLSISTLFTTHCLTAFANFIHHILKARVYPLTKTRYF